MRYPKFLDQLHNNLYLIAPSFGCTTEPYKSRLYKALDVFKEYDINPVVRTNVFSSIGYRSASCTECADEFVDAYINSNFIMSVGGGNLENEILDYIDFDKLKDLEPKWFMGYSDNTNLTFTLNTLLDVASIYGPCAPEFGTFQLHEAQIDSLKLIKGEKMKFKGYDKFELESKKTEELPYEPYNLDTKKELICTPKEIHMEGRLIGGCIDCLTYLIGTKYDKVKEFNEKYKDIIWFLESCDLEAWNLKLALLQMKRHGWFDSAKGFIIGRPLKYNTDFIGLSMNDAVLDVLKDLNVPIILNADFGHLKPQIPIISGAYAKIGAIDNDLDIEYILK